MKLNKGTEFPLNVFVKIQLQPEGCTRRRLKKPWRTLLDSLHLIRPTTGRKVGCSSAWKDKRFLVSSDNKSDTTCILNQINRVKAQSGVCIFCLAAATSCVLGKRVNLVYIFR